MSPGLAPPQAAFQTHSGSASRCRIPCPPQATPLTESRPLQATPLTEEDLAKLEGMEAYAAQWGYTLPTAVSPPGRVVGSVAAAEEGAPRETVTDPKALQPAGARRPAAASTREERAALREAQAKLDALLGRRWPEGSVMARVEAEEERRMEERVPLGLIHSPVVGR